MKLDPRNELPPAATVYPGILAKGKLFGFVGLK
jgi:hypothetical protein